MRASMRGYPSGDDVFARSGDHLYTSDQLRTWRTLRAVRFAGFFEGRSTVAIGVRDGVPFRAFSALEGGERGKVVVDVALR